MAKTLSITTLAILAAMEDVYDTESPAGSVQLTSQIGRADILADFIHREVADVTSGYEYTPEGFSNAASEAASAMGAAADELAFIIDGLAMLEDQYPDATSDRILRIIDAYYHCGALNVDKPLKRNVRGDTLADFLHFSISRNCYADKRKGNVSAAIAILQDARNKLERCYEVAKEVGAPYQLSRQRVECAA